jgi:hypothetical protein
MIKPVQVFVTGTRTGFGPVVPYRHGTGLQYYVTATGFLTTRPVVYEVPTYEVRIKGGSSYDAVRFGLRYKDDTTPDTRPRDTGLSH